MRTDARLRIALMAWLPPGLPAITSVGSCSGRRCSAPRRALDALATDSATPEDRSCSNTVLPLRMLTTLIVRRAGSSLLSSGAITTAQSAGRPVSDIRFAISGDVRFPASGTAALIVSRSSPPTNELPFTSPIVRRSACSTACCSVLSSVMMATRISGSISGARGADMATPADCSPFCATGPVAISSGDAGDGPRSGTFIAGDGILVVDTPGLCRSVTDATSSRAPPAATKIGAKLALRNAYRGTYSYANLASAAVTAALWRVLSEGPSTMAFCKSAKSSEQVRYRCRGSLAIAFASTRSRFRRFGRTDDSGGYIPCVMLCITFSILPSNGGLPDKA